MALTRTLPVPLSPPQSSSVRPRHLPDDPRAPLGWGGRVLPALTDGGWRVLPVTFQGTGFGGGPPKPVLALASPHAAFRGLPAAAPLLLAFTCAGTGQL